MAVEVEGRVEPGHHFVVEVACAVLLVAVCVLVVARDVVPLSAQPTPDATSYAHLAENLGHGSGYEVDIAGEPEGSRYPPGFPVMLAPILRAGVPVERAAQGFTVALIVAVWALARRIGGPAAGGVAVVVLATSEALMEQSSYVMADVAGALVTVLAGWCVVSGHNQIAGVLAGWAAWTRLAAVVAIAGMRRRAWLPFSLVVLALAVVKLRTGFGYRGGQIEWSIGNAFSDAALASNVTRGGNLWAYLTALAGVGGSLTVPGVMAVAVWGAWRLPGGRWALAASAATVAVYVPYFWQAERFMFPVLALGAVYAGGGVAHLAESVSTRRLAPEGR